ncbi:toxin [Streptomyces sp. NPDC059740]|uniref:toxin n=1 Tax=Streptomyces sp. NPDC059740 TaxID=3346926 RepID=UPI003664A3AF
MRPERRHPTAEVPMSLRRLRKQLERSLADFPIPDPFGIPALVREMEARLGRRILLRPMPPALTAPGSACGLRVKLSSSASLVLFPLRSTPYHQGQVILHELVHEWFDHGGTVGPEELRHMMPHLGTGLIARFTRGVPMAARTTYGSEQELHTELSASIIRDWAARQEESGSGDALLRGLDDTLSHPFARRRRTQK